ncbi:MAG: Fic family protein [Anaerolineales bacterium]
MRFLSVNEVLELHNRVVQASGGALGLLDLGALESAAAQPRMVFDGQELYPTLTEKAAAPGFSLYTKSSVPGWQQAHRPCRPGDVSGFEWPRNQSYP